MNISLWIARRLRLRGNGGSGAGVVIAVTGVALALMILEFTLAIVTGFKDGIRSRLSGFDAQVTVEAQAGDHIEYTEKLKSVIEAAMPDGIETRLAIRRPGLLKTDNDFEGIIFLAQSPESDFSFERGNMVAGEWPDYSADSTRNHIVLSTVTASALGLTPGDKVYGTFFVDNNVKLRRYTVAGLYRSNFGEYDRTVAYASLPAMQSVSGVDSLLGTRVDIRGLNSDDIEPAAAHLQDAIVQAAASGVLDTYYPVNNIKRSGAVYFNWLALLDTNVVVIFILMLCVGGLTLVSSLFILILDRIPLIGVLRSMGADKKTVRRIFIDLAMRLAGIGMLAGNAVGLGLLWVQQATGIVPLDPEMYYLNAVPVRIEFVPFLLLNVGVAAASWLVLVLPARLASNIDPAKTIKYD